MKEKGLGQYRSLHLTRLALMNTQHILCLLLTDHCLYAVAHQHRQEAMVRGSASAVDDVGKLWCPFQMDNRS